VNDFAFGTQTCGRLDAGAAREWLVADGRGGYAMGTVSGLRTRRYHALLVVANGTPSNRSVGLAALDATVVLPSGARIPLGTHEWASGTVDPRGFELLEGFDLVDGVPRWRWRIGDLVLEREIAAQHGQPAVVVVHRLVSGPPVRVELSALCTWRDAHGERYADGPALRIEPVANGVVIESSYRIHGPGWQPDGTWWRGAYLREEAARGLPAQEDLWCAGRFMAALQRPGAVVDVHAWKLGGAPSYAETVNKGPFLPLAGNSRGGWWQVLV